MDNKEENTKQSFLNDYNFLQDDDFIRWRLFQTIELDEYWDDFLKKNPLQEESLKRAITQFNEVMKLNRYPLSTAEKKKMYRSILRKISRREKIWKISIIYSTAAISIIAALFLFYFILYKGGDQEPNINTDVIIGQTLPEEEIYLISGGTKINIAHKSQINLTGDGKALVIDSADFRKELMLSSAQYNKLVVPYGKRTNLTLSDGTKVWLNSGTQLDFPVEFIGGKREIRINGEIFIDVAHNPIIPFVVHARDMDIHVFGTSFNVSAYEDESKKTIVLVGGKVIIETEGGQITELKPNEKIEVTGEKVTREHVNISEYISWTKGILEFDETPVSEILKRIGRYYNVQFESSPDITLNDKTCSGKLFLSNNLDRVMMSVSVITSTVYQRENNIIHITKK